METVELYPVNEPHQARADLNYILKNMHEYQVKQQLLEEDRLISQKSLESKRAEMIRAAKAIEKDPLIKELLEKGIAQKSREMSIADGHNLNERATQLRREMWHKIMAEIARYAREHHIFIVRSANYSNRHEDASDSEGHFAGQFGILFIAGRDNKQEIDISDEIVKRLNAEKSTKSTNGTRVFSFDVGLTR